MNDRQPFISDRTRPSPAPLLAFTLIELMVVVAIIGIMVSMLMPALRLARAKAMQVDCISNLRQLFLANELYATDAGHYVSAAPDLFTTNRRRWHGGRAGVSGPFDAAQGPLAPYLGSSKTIRRCRALKEVDVNAGANAFEASCGGFGYNALGVGSQIYLLGLTAAASRQGMEPSSIQKPSHTIMFADCALPQPYGSDADYLIEYSFAEPCHWVFQPGVESANRPLPSIHFRHNGKANVVWCDGHVTSEPIAGWVSGAGTKWNIGWFGPANNVFFDPY